MTGVMGIMDITVITVTGIMVMGITVVVTTTITTAAGITMGITTTITMGITITGTTGTTPTTTTTSATTNRSPWISVATQTTTSQSLPRSRKGMVAPLRVPPGHPVPVPELVPTRWIFTSKNLIIITPDLITTDHTSPLDVIQITTGCSSTTRRQPVAVPPWWWCKFLAKEITQRPRGNSGISKHAWGKYIHFGIRWTINMPRWFP